MTIVIRVEHLSKRYGKVRALQDVSFGAARGRIVGLLGPNGAGKSTTMRVLAGLVPPTGGSASIDGHDTVEQSLASRRLLGYLPETPPLYPEMRVRSFLRFRGSLCGMGGRALREAIATWMDRCWLGEVAHQRIGALSKGFRQRVGIAATLLHDPPAVMLDEPISGLDPEQISLARELIRDLGRTKAVLFSSHILSEVEAVCDDVVIIARGEVLAQGPLREVLAESKAKTCYHIEVTSQHAERLWKHLTSVKSIASVRLETKTQDWHRLLVDAEDEADDLREVLARCAHDAGALVRELRTDKPTLERLYMQLLTGDSA